ncbi:putative selenophosphate synthetase [Cyclospora cayetanensis]|uniref:Selenophosphate synthetase n=1 Tax=Cyclospora cayetanensis TaxID=88456 RepID=A0A1D3CUM0_9EIME|nr:putative selenophosphate synthetase [Cyclospora cayetanensis]
MWGPGSSSQQRQVVLVGAGQAHLDVLRLWGERRLREAEADKTKPPPAAARPQASTPTDTTAAALLRSFLGKDAAAVAGAEDEGLKKDPVNIPVSAVSLLLVTETTEVLYSAMVPGYIAGEFKLSDLTVDLAPLCVFAGASLILARAVGLLPKDRLLLLDGRRPPLRFDVLSIDTGSKPDLPLIPGSLRPLAFCGNSSAESTACTALRFRRLATSTAPYCACTEQRGRRAEGPRVQKEKGGNRVGSSLHASCLSVCGGCEETLQMGEILEQIHEISKGRHQRKTLLVVLRLSRHAGGIVSRWLLLKQQLQRAWHQARDNKNAGLSASGSLAHHQQQGPDGASSTNSSNCKADESPRFRILIIGGGAVGVEMALTVQFAVQQLLRSLERQDEEQQQHYISSTCSSHKEEAESKSPCVSPLKAEVVLATSGSDILTGYAKRAQSFLRRLLNVRGVQVFVNCRVERVEETPEGRWRAIAANKALEGTFDCSFCCTSARPQDWIQSTRLPVDENGFLKVLPTLQCVDFPSIFAAGDTASIIGHSRPKAGVYAGIRLLRRRVSSVLANAESLRACIEMDRRRGLYAQRKGVKSLDSSWLASHRIFPNSPKSASGGETAALLFFGLRELGAAAASGAEALSAWVSASVATCDASSDCPSTNDLPHPCLAVFARLLVKAATCGAEGCGRSPRCAGCSGKMPQRALSAALQQLRMHNTQLELHDQQHQMLNSEHAPEEQDWELKPLFTRPEVICGLRSPDDCCLFSPLPLADTRPNAQPVPLLAQSVDFFRFFTGDLYSMGRISAAHALSDLYACGAEPLTALAVTLMQRAPPDLVRFAVVTAAAASSFAAPRRPSWRCRAIFAHALSSGCALMRLQQANNLLQVLAGATSVLAEEGCELAGGHSAVGDGPSAAGFVVTGRILYPPVGGDSAAGGTPAAAAGGPPRSTECLHSAEENGEEEQKQKQIVFPGKQLAPGFPLRKGSAGVCHGSVLLLTKGWVETALQQMQQTNQAAMHALLQHGATACTDITGFGLAGHLLEVVDASNRALAKLGSSEKPAALGATATAGAAADGNAAAESASAERLVGARVWLERLPLLPGVSELTSQGFFASLFVENAATAARRLVVSSAEDIKGEPPLASLHEGNVRGLSPTEQPLEGERELLQVLQQQLHGPCCCRLPAPVQPKDVAQQQLMREETAPCSNTNGSYTSACARATYSDPSRSCCCCSTCNDASLVFPLLFDPQTSGGLLAVVPAAAAASCLKALRAHCPAMAIGDIVSLSAASAADAGVSRKKPIQIVARSSASAPEMGNVCS